MIAVFQLSFKFEVIFFLYLKNRFKISCFIREIRRAGNLVWWKLYWEQAVKRKSSQFEFLSKISWKFVLSGLYRQILKMHVIFIITLNTNTSRARLGCSFFLIYEKKFTSLFILTCVHHTAWLTEIQSFNIFEPFNVSGKSCASLGT